MNDEDYAKVVGSITISVNNLNPKKGQIVFFKIPVTVEPYIRHFVFSSRFDILVSPEKNPIYIRYEKDYKIAFEIDDTITQPSVRIVKIDDEIEMLTVRPPLVEFFHNIWLEIKNVFVSSRRLFYDE